MSIPGDLRDGLVMTGDGDWRLPRTRKKQSKKQRPLLSLIVDLVACMEWVAYYENKEPPWWTCEFCHGTEPNHRPQCPMDALAKLVRGGEQVKLASGKKYVLGIDAKDPFKMHALLDDLMANAGSDYVKGRKKRSAGTMAARRAVLDLYERALRGKRG